MNERKVLFKYLPKILKTNGIIFLSTLNRNIVSTFMSINIAENLLKILHKNTHDPKLYLKPSEIQTLYNKNVIKLLKVPCISYNHVLKTFRF